MGYKISCTDSQYPFSVLVESLEEEDLETEEFTSCLDEWISNIILDVEPKPIGFFPEEWLNNCPLYTKGREKIDSILQEKLVIKDSEKDNLISTKTKECIAAIDGIFEYHEGSEQSYVDVGAYALKCLECFLNEGEWQYALRSQSGELYPDVATWNLTEYEGKRQWLHESEVLEPCLWFGLLNQPISECWKFPEFKHLLETDGYELFNWSVLMDTPDEKMNSYAIWMFWECGMSEPNNEELLESCPIKLDSHDSKEELYAKIEQFFLEKYNSVHK